jgi:hypothetical protein
MSDEIINPTETETDLELVPTSGAIALTSEIRAQVETARAYPRRMSKFRQRALELTTLDVETAQSCMYTLKRGGKPIVGPSVRFAELIAIAWGNLRISAELAGDDGRVVRCFGVCHDLESNVAVRVPKERRITDKEGRTFSDDMKVVTANACSSIALRDAIFRVVPKAIWKHIYDKTRSVAAGGEGGTQTFTDRRAAALLYFRGLGVSQRRVCHAVGREKVEDIGFAELEVLIGLATALKNGETTPEEAFPEAEPEIITGTKATEEQKK